MCAANCGTCASAVQFDIPAVNTSVVPSALPLWTLPMISPSDMGPIWCPFFAMYHCCGDICDLLRLPPAGCSLLAPCQPGAARWNPLSNDADTAHETEL
jgi:hypothetical protein